MANIEGKLPDILSESVLKSSVPVPEDFVEVKGIDYDKPESRNMKAKDLIKGMRTMGFQASSLSEACEIIDEMRQWRGKHIDDLEEHDRKGEFDGEGYQKSTIFMGYTSNLISSGLRDTLRYLVQNKMISAIVASAGGIEEDLIKCLAPTYMGDFALKGKGLRDQGMNRIGNLLVPNDNYCKFEEWIVPILDSMLEEQEQNVVSKGVDALDGDAMVWTPSTVIDRLGKEINDETSVLYWAHKNKIPVFCPSLTDGSIGDMLFFHTFKASPKQLRIDLVNDIRRINSMSMEASKAGMLILGGGLIKHHIANACLMRNGADWAVYVNTGQEFDGSDAGARPDEAVSWGKIKAEARSVKVFADVTLVFPLMVAATFASE
ncbi:Deoxyhypusine synthase [Komagataella phaffii CBS 7435]|uniref:Deoxyhypusine synthase n=2 Tax=Komagataella phaffii TaxID=460519 RepID=C4QVK2_KOMPG|nr:Deoxyhypusine synthase, catalyzes formation of deoxyhypusine [Komagataella phaffii GS115]AOA60377.1 GQ67_02471T0 [Komagataella phaffii]KAI0465306.1 Deoxyhypusine synthase [Komagataella kurtzmanii]CAH2445931.1 Deoxyhypusine synthase [Komagataella phaffii CBS 7435]AOA66897.1 GQ68_02776T0 [Komagataella phaffii GS115]CAY67275.1 Deoxyhypusine synthase, catalyzes formation of deoxyhypusine [Komagataella phaffii GS115]